MIELTDDDIKKIEGIAHKLVQNLGMFYDPQLLQDLVSEGKIGFYSAIKRYDEAKNTYFWGFAYRRVQGSMLDYIRKYVRYNKSHMVGQVIDTTSTPSLSYYDKALSIMSQINTTSLDLYSEDMERDFTDFVKKEITASEFNILYDYYIKQTPISRLSHLYERPTHRIVNIIDTLSKQIYDSCFAKYD
jgi:RNA polymerase sigma factor (sigma-70 family)